MGSLRFRFHNLTRIVALQYFLPTKSVATVRPSVRSPILYLNHVAWVCFDCKSTLMIFGDRPTPAYSALVLSLFCLKFIAFFRD
ncbi:hypothetical protein L596_026195 [Steinernema carpocapsae]|uniref:Uncharacterized protein n=1 Tax=Steinernema carpocapsae TaxID=34508 RepID=A0A4U5M0M6_STECR|nr:hypothetical protein L596_026195 [Steinernema carpocapsae]